MNSKSTLFHIIAVAYFFQSNNGQVVELTGNSWHMANISEFKCKNPEVLNNLTNFGGAIQATVPGDVFMDLFKAGDLGKIAEPLQKYNDVNLRWVGNQSWCYWRAIPIEKQTLTHLSLVLVQRGLDTISSTFINGKLVNKSENMWHEFFTDITSALRPIGSDIISIYFEPPAQYARNMSVDFRTKYGYAVPNDGPPTVQNGLNHVNFIRKMQAAFSWDWGPGFATMGIWKDIYMEKVVEGGCISDKITAVPILKDQYHWEINHEIHLFCVSDIPSISIKTSIRELNFTTTKTAKNLKKGRNVAKTVFLIDSSKVELWYPNGYGKQRLYTVESEAQGNNSVGVHFTTRNVSTKFGFRTVELIQESVTKCNKRECPVFVEDPGLTFYFRINGIPVFLKGTNWIPADSFNSRITADRLKFYFESMKFANMNSMRVWGGGVYESDLFYQLADEYGFLIWQDMMFAVNLYPANQEFLDNVKREIETSVSHIIFSSKTLIQKVKALSSQQINRLKSHPSIIIWAGNNENELGLLDHWFSSKYPMAKLEQYKSDYMKLYNDTVWGAVNETDYSSRPYVLSSPSGGIDTIRNHGFSGKPSGAKYGDVHFYTYVKNAWDDATYPISRCTTEFGFQSFPNFGTMEDALGGESAKDDIYLMFGPNLLHRQHHPAGNFEMLLQSFQHMPVPWKGNNSTMSNKEFFKASTFLTQIHQAYGYKTEVEHYRRYRNRTTTTGEGYTMCSLYWQLNDIWQAPSWASIDYNLQWKMAHYYARHFFAPLLTSIWHDGKENLIKVVIVNDDTNAVNAKAVTVRTLQLGRPGFQALETHSAKIKNGTIQPFSSEVVLKFNARPNLWGRIMYEATLLDKNGKTLGHPNYILPNYLPCYADACGHVKMDKVYVNENTGVISIDLSAESVVLFVRLEVPKISGWFSDNGFVMTQPNFTVDFYSWNGKVDLETFKQSLSVISVQDLYNYT